MLQHLHSPAEGTSGPDFVLNDSTKASFGDGGAVVPLDAYFGFFICVWRGMGMIIRVITHSKVRDWLQLVLLGVTAELARRLFKHLIVCVRRTILIRTVHAPNDDSYDWLMGEFRGILRQRGLTAVTNVAYWLQDERWKDRCRKL